MPNPYWEYIPEGNQAFARYAERPCAVHAFLANSNPLGHLLQDMLAFVINLHRTVKGLVWTMDSHPRAKNSWPTAVG